MTQPHTLPVGPALRALQSRWVYALCLAIVVTLGVAGEVRSLAGPDIGFFLYAAGEVLDGARLYRDIVEINPPLIVAVNIPPVLLARTTGWSEIVWYRVFVTLLLLGSLGLSGAVLRRVMPVPDEPIRRWSVCLLAFALFLVGAADYGQREHLLAACVFPYLLLSAGRARGIEVPAPLALGTGILAGFGFSLKPHFLLVWLVTEAGRLALHKGRRPRLEIEGLAVGLLLIAYGGVTLLLTPEYPDLVRLLAHDYRRYLPVPVEDLLLDGTRTPLLMIATLVSVGLVGRARYPELWIVLLLAMVAGFVAAVLQGKGWRYHFYPSMATMYVLLGIVAVDVRGTVGDRVRALYAVIALAVLATGTLWFTGSTALRGAGLDAQQQRDEARLAEIVRALRSRDLGPGVFVFSFATASGFPLVNYARLHWASRFPQLWLLVAIYWDRLTADGPLRFRDPGEMGSVERYLNDAVYQDLAVHKPAALLVLRHARDVRANGPRRMDYLGYFGRDPRTAELLRQYRFAGDVGEYRLYERMRDGEQPMEAITRPAPGTLDLPPRPAVGWRGVAKNRALLIQLALFFAIVALALGTVRTRNGKEAE